MLYLQLADSTGIDPQGYPSDILVIIQVIGEAGSSGRTHIYI